MIEALVSYWPAFLSGAAMTLAVAALCWTMGVALGFLIGLAASRHRAGGRLLSTTSFVLTAIPAVVILFWAHYPAQALVGVVIHPFITTVVVLTILNTIYVADIVSFSGAALAREYIEAAYTHGWTRSRASRVIEVPLIIRASASRIIAVQVVVLHMTLFSSFISLDELFRAAQRVNSIEYRPVEIYTALALAYFLLSAPLLLISSQLSRRYGRDFSER